MHWEIRLIGDATDLIMLSESMCGGDISICEKDGEYIMRSKELDGLQDADKIRACAEEIATSISGTARIVLSAHKPIRIGGISQIRDDGTRNTFVQAEPAVGHGRAFPGSVSITREDGTVERHHPADPVKDWLEVAARDPSIAKALRLRNTGNLTWGGLYRIYEVIEGDISKKVIVASGWAEDSEISRFKHTANSVAAAGDQARHGKETTQPPKNPMSLGEAKAFVDALFRAWVKSKT